MRSKKNPPAFPHESLSEIFPGMELRDYFAAKAMQGALQNEALLKRMGNRVNGDLEAGHADLAAGAYAVADAMLAVRVMRR